MLCQVALAFFYFIFLLFPTFISALTFFILFLLKLTTYFIKEENIDAHASVTEFEKHKASTQKNFKPRIERGIRYRPTKPFTTFVAQEKNLDVEIEEKEIEEYTSSKRIKLI